MRIMLAASDGDADTVVSERDRCSTDRMPRVVPTRGSLACPVGALGGE